MPENRWLSLVQAALVGLAISAPLVAAGDALARLGAGLKLFDLQRYSEAAREFERALRDDPTLQDARYHLAVSRFNQREYSAARRHFDALAPSGFRKDWVTYYLARIDLVEQNLDAAIARFLTLTRNEPLQDELYYLGSAYMKQASPERAAASLERQVKFNPRDYRAHELLARAYSKLGRPVDAEREFAQSRQLHAYYLEGKKELVTCRERLNAGQAEEAWTACGSVLTNDDIDKLVAVGMLFGEFGQYDRALQAFEKALTLDPESPEVNFDLGLTLFRKKDYPKARTYLETAARLRPNFFDAAALLGTVLYVLREDAAARHALERANRLKPGDEAVAKMLADLNRAGER